MVNIRKISPSYYQNFKLSAGRNFPKSYVDDPCPYPNVLHPTDTCQPPTGWGMPPVSLQIPLARNNISITAGCFSHRHSSLVHLYKTNRTHHFLRPSYQSVKFILCFLVFSFLRFLLSWKRLNWVCLWISFLAWAWSSWAGRCRAWKTRLRSATPRSSLWEIPLVLLHPLRQGFSPVGLIQLLSRLPITRRLSRRRSLSGLSCIWAVGVLIENHQILFMSYWSRSD